MKGKKTTQNLFRNEAGTFDNAYNQSINSDSSHCTVLPHMPAILSLVPSSSRDYVLELLLYVSCHFWKLSVFIPPLCFFFQIII